MKKCSIRFRLRKYPENKPKKKRFLLEKYRFFTHEVLNSNEIFSIQLYLFTGYTSIGRKRMVSFFFHKLWLK